MPSFKYVAKDNQGKDITGTMEAESRGLAIETLRKSELTIISIEEQKGRVKEAVSRKRIKLDDLVVFSRQLATMVDSGIPLVQALDVLSEQIEKRTLRQIVVKVRSDIETGSSLSEALSRHPTVFSGLYVNMVRAGETSGMLDEILDRLAGYLEKASALQRKVRASLIYPIVVTVMAILITAVLLLKVIPTFKGIFDLLGGTLPLPTQILIGISDFTRQYFPVAVAMLILVGYIFRRSVRTEKGRRRFDAQILRLPVFGPLLRKVAVAKFTRTLSTLVKSGVPILTSLDIVGRTSGNKVIEEAVVKVRSSISDGESIAEPLANSGVFPPMVVRMVAVGEKTGELEKMLSKIADFYDEQVDAAVSGLTSMIEPLIIAFLGIVIGAIVIAMFMPIFKLTEIVGAR